MILNIKRFFRKLKKYIRRLIRRLKKLYKVKIVANGGAPLFVICLAGIVIFGVVAAFGGVGAKDDYFSANADYFESDSESVMKTETDSLLEEVNDMVSDATEEVGSVAEEIRSENSIIEESLEEQTAETHIEETVPEITTQAETIPETTKSPYADIAVTYLGNSEDYVNVRSEPSTEGEKLGKIYNDCAATILDTVEGEGGSWYHIRSGSVTGYIKSEYFITGEKAEKKALEIGRMFGRVNAGGLRLREEPNTESEIITSLWEGEIYTVLADAEGFTQITLGKDDDGNEVAGYVKSEYIDTYIDFDTAISKEEEEAAIAEAKRREEEAKRLEEEARAKAAAEAEQSKRNAIVAYAKQFIGNPYVWGGTSLTKGADCSGFVKSVYAHFGISLTRTSATQAGCGTPISISKLKTGDLVFYARGSKIYHVAIYIGNGQIIHAIDEHRGIGITSMYFATPYSAVTLF